MSISLYDISVASYLQVLGGVQGVLEKGAAHIEEQGLDAGEIVEARLHADMLPLRFQLVSVAHHSLGALNGLREGVFTPPPQMPDLNYADLQALVADASTQLLAVSKDEVEEMAGKALTFNVNDMKIPFTAENFLLTFSLPNVYFHATTAYDILRMKGVSLGKMDYLGQMRMG